MWRWWGSRWTVLLLAAGLALATANVLVDAHRIGAHPCPPAQHCPSART
jgi:hypothetical protein